MYQMLSRKHCPMVLQVSYHLSDKSLAESVHKIQWYWRDRRDPMAPVIKLNVLKAQFCEC
jgi:hypothetical protein